ncbi:MAG: agmatine deiminase family protein, partial [Planctomycetia bacterium]|nr:agmatine deiminase family protein [Planctomycetia bacterium]
MATAASAYRLPAEWEPHAATWLAWPHRRATWLGDFAAIPPVFETVARLLARYEPVTIVAAGPVLAEARGRLDGVANVGFVDLPTNDAWLRDTGPVFVVPRDRSHGARPAAVCWGWNAWGGKYPPWDRDAALGRALAGRLGIDVVDGGLVLEGGGLETDGEGTLLVNHRCLEDPARNPGVSRPRLEEILCARLGVDRVLWVGGELAGDDTDGHIDQLARFVAPGCVVAARQPDPLDPNHASLEATLAVLGTLVDASGRRLEVLPIDIPPRFAFEGTQLPASHLNFYVGNGFVAVPVFGACTDEAALATLAGCFPGRSIEPVDCRDLVRGR